MTAITRAYHFLMQFSPRDEIKGDYTVQARGSSVLLVREIQAQNLLLLASQMSVHPVLGQHFKIRNLLKVLLQSMMISSDDVLKTELELMAEAARSGRGCAGRASRSRDGETPAPTAACPAGRGVEDGACPA